MGVTATVYGERVTVLQVDGSDRGWVWVQVQAHGAVRWERLTRFEWREANVR